MDFAELLLRLTSCGLTSRISFSTIANGLQYPGGRIPGYQQHSVCVDPPLAGDTGKVMIVGDDDQSIYGGVERRWRIFSVSSMISPVLNYPSGAELPLYQQYSERRERLIENNNGRLGKKLWTDGADGSLFPSIALLTNSMKRVLWLTYQNLAGQRRGACRVRHSLPSNAQSRVLEEALLQASMPYRFTAGCASSNARKSKMRSHISPDCQPQRRRGL